MCRRALKLAPLVFAAALLAASPSTAANHIVTVGPDTAFHPDTLTIDVGDTVTWMNAGGTIVRFTPSRVMVEIQQISTNTTNTYELTAVPADSEELSGRQDRTGFLP